MDNLLTCSSALDRTDLSGALSARWAEAVSERSCGDVRFDPEQTLKQPRRCPHGHPPIDIDTLPQHAARDDEGKKAFLHRFVVAGAAIR